jgi:hypothetical protein
VRQGTHEAISRRKACEFARRTNFLPPMEEAEAYTPPGARRCRTSRRSARSAFDWCVSSAQPISCVSIRRKRRSTSCGSLMTT